MRGQFRQGRRMDWTTKGVRRPVAHVIVHDDHDVGCVLPPSHRFGDVVFLQENSNRKTWLVGGDWFRWGSNKLFGEKKRQKNKRRVVKNLGEKGCMSCQDFC